MTATTTYGALGLSAFIITLLAIGCITCLAIASLAYVYTTETSDWSFSGYRASLIGVVGLLFHVLSLVAFLILMATWLTSMTEAMWNDAGPFPVVGALVLLGVVISPIAIVLRD